MILLSQTGASEAEGMPGTSLSSNVACAWGDDCGRGAKNGSAEPQQLRSHLSLMETGLQTLIFLVLPW